ncbi:MAG: hypothetical protein HPY50_20230 [Firmicutes bacterium]|nr:hypothetical protein [Bacillota bacterium]
MRRIVRYRVDPQDIMEDEADTQFFWGPWGWGGGFWGRPFWGPFWGPWI